MRGVILAGGHGTRLRPMTTVINKHLLPVYDRPMIYYPIQTLKNMGIDDILIVSGGENIGGFAELLGDGSQFGVRLTYRVQAEAAGIAQALSCVQDYVGKLFAVILGDNYFEVTPADPTRPTLYYKQIDQPERFGVYNPKTNQIVEKPREFIGNQAITGLYIYDRRVFDWLKILKPSARGEYEITDINNLYLQQDACDLVQYPYYWSDMGTVESLHGVASFVGAKS